MKSIQQLKGGKSAGWNRTLAKMVEHEVTENKPIVQASRNHTLIQVHNWMRHDKDGILVEIGCSTGNTLKYFDNSLSQKTLIGADYVFQPLKDLADGNSGLTLVQLDVGNCPFRKESIDCVIILNVLEHIERHEIAIEQLHGILKNDGILVVEVPAMSKLYDAFDKHVMHFRRYDMNDLTTLLEDAGFEILSKSHLGFLLYPVFWLGKMRNRRYLNASAEEQKKVALRTLRRGNDSIIMRYFFKIEEYLRRIVYLPLGIRCLVTCRKVI